MSNTEVANALGVDRAYLTRVRKRLFPKTLQPKTLARIRAFLAYAPQKPTIRTTVSEAPVAAPRDVGIGVRLWIQRFAVRLTEAGCSEDEVEDARRTLTDHARISYVTGGGPARLQDTEEDKLKVVKLIAEQLIIPRLKTLGRDVNAKLAH
jgi:hypothetical protein